MSIHLMTNDLFTKKVKDRFFSQIESCKEGCWIWKGALLKNGYGQFHYKAKTCYAHRISYEMFYGRIPDGALVLHKCDEKRCVSPYHLYLGSYTDNINDRYTRHPESGRAFNRSKFNYCESDMIKLARDEGMTYEDIANIFNVSRQTISNIVNGRTTIFREA